MSASSSDQQLVPRDLELGDYHKGYLQLLGQLTTVGDVTEQQFADRLKELHAAAPDYKIVVIEDPSTSRIIASATAAIERKFIHQCGKVAHIEDVVVDEAYRGRRLGYKLIDALIEASKAQGCYKVILDCSEANAPFYEKCGLTRKEVQMVKYLDR